MTWIKIETDNLNKVPNLDSLEFNEDGLFLYCDFDGVQKTLFLNAESDLSTWFNDTSFDIHKDEYKSYVVAALFHIVEVLSKKPPVILDNTN